MGLASPDVMLGRTTFAFSGMHLKSFSGTGLTAIDHEITYLTLLNRKKGKCIITFIGLEYPRDLPYHSD